MFDIDFTKYKLVDLSLEVALNQTVPYRPFEATLGKLGDGTNKYDITNTHTHVGTHIESPWHFYGKGNTCTDYPLEKFMGKATVVDGVIHPGEDRVSLETIKKQLDGRPRDFRILYVRNATDKPMRFSFDCVPYFAEFNLDLFIFDSTIEFGEGLQNGLDFHDKMMSRGTLLIEFPANGTALDQEFFYVMALPLKIKGIDSSWCRLMAILEK